MADRQDLQAILVGLGWERVYYVPESNVTMVYPCVRYEMDDIYRENAGNKAYLRQTRYQLTAISTNVDDPLFDTFADLPLCSFDRAYRSGQLYHQVFNIYF